MSVSNVRKALMSAAKGVLDAQGFDGAISYENVPFDPSEMPKWAAISFVPNQPFVTTLGAGGDDRVTGFLQVDLNVPQGQSIGAMDAWVDALRAEFIAGKGFTNGGIVTTITNTGVNAGSMFDNWYRKSVTITYRADLPRTVI